MTGAVVSVFSKLLYTDMSGPGLDKAIAAWRNPTPVLLESSVVARDITLDHKETLAQV